MKGRDIVSRIRASIIWLSRIGHCRGFGIQSPSDYWIVRYVINEHWPYYKYETLGRHDDWLTRKLGRLCFRVANWLQPSVVESNDYREYLQAGCMKSQFGESTELVVMALDRDGSEHLSYIYKKVSPQLVLIVTGINRARKLWSQIINDKRTGITFDLYYCGIILFDKKRDKRNYIINF